MKEVFFEWMRAHRPDLMPRYEELYNGRSYVPAAEKKRIAEMVDSVRPPAAQAPPARPPARAGDRRAGGSSTRRQAQRPAADAQARLF